MKKLLFLTLATIFSVMARAYDAKIDGIYYNFDKTAKTAEVTYYWNNSSNRYAYSDTVNIPATVDYGGEIYDVTRIGHFAFEYCSGLTSVTIPNSVTDIGYRAFSGTGWYNNQPDGILYLDNWLIGYKGEKPIGSVTINESTRGIGGSAFHSCSGITSIVIPDGVISIGDYAFFACSGLTTVTIPNSVTNIGECAFRGNSNMVSVTLSNSVTILKGGIFYGCNSLSSISIPRSVTRIEDYCYDAGYYCGVFGGCSCLISVSIPNSVTSIGSYAFDGCSGLTSASIPNSVTNIGDGAFYGCSSLASVTIPSSVTSIGKNAFSYCRGLSNLTISNSVTSIKNGTFQGCSSLTSVTLPNSVTSIEDGDAPNNSNYSGAFANCSSLTSVTIPNNVTSIGSFAFAGCNSLTSLTIPDGVTTIKSGTFYGCSKLTHITIPKSVTSIENGHYFFGAYNYGAFENCYSLYSFTIPDDMLNIGSAAFQNCTSLTSITIPDKVTSIGASAFSGCSGLTSIKIGNGITLIDESSFSNCRSVDYLKLPESLTIIKKWAFAGCRALKSVTIPASVEFIYQEAFANCTNLENVKALPETPPFLYDNSFSNYNIPLYTPASAVDVYKSTNPWSKFAQFLTLDGQEVEVSQCATPTIDCINWKLVFECETEGAEIVSEVKCNDTKRSNEGEVSLTPTYTITAYAKAEGYRDSDVATATISWENGKPVLTQGFRNVTQDATGIKGDVNDDGAIDVADIATIISLMAGEK